MLKKNVFGLLAGLMIAVYFCGCELTQPKSGEVGTNLVLPSEPIAWEAQWIGTGDARDQSPVNQWICYRRVIDLPAAPKSAIAHIAVDSKYWLWINGQMVVFEGGLRRGPTPNDTYFDTVDLAEYLCEGENTIAVLMWHFGKDGFSHKSSGRAGMVFQGMIDGWMLAGDAQWKTKVHPAYSTAEGEIPNYRLPESNIQFDARADIDGWNQPGFNDGDWAPAHEYGKPPVEPWGGLVPRPTPLWKDYGLKEYVDAPEMPFISDGKTIIVKLPYNAQITPYLEVEAPAGKQVDIRTDNYNGGSAPNVHAVYVTRDGVQSYESLGWMNGHDVRYAIPEGVKVLGLKYRETGYNTEFAGGFRCDDPFYNKLWEKARRTLYITMRDTYMDCPDRERSQWWGDAVNELGEAFYALDPDSRHLARKGIAELMNWQREDKTIFSPVPAGNWDKELPMQMLASVGYYGFWNYFMHSGDARTIENVYPRVCAYLSVWETRDNGLVVPRKGGWTWGDWGENKDMTILYNGWYYLALKGQREMAALTGHDGDIAGIDAKMKALASAFNETFWTGSEYRSPGYEGQTDDRAHALAVVAGIAAPDMYPAIRKVFSEQYHASPYMEKYVLEALCIMGYVDDAMARMKKRFAPMVDSELTTLWEGWGIGSEGFGGGTYNHAWSGGGLTILSQYIAGIAPITPGYETYQVTPRMNGLKQAEATVSSVAGVITVALQKNEQDFGLELNSPAGTTAIVAIPVDSETTSIIANAKVVWSAAGAAKRLKGVSPVDHAGGYCRFKVAPGQWSFRTVQGGGK